jgi:hypothetical protein
MFTPCRGLCASATAENSPECHEVDFRAEEVIVAEAVTPYNSVVITFAVRPDLLHGEMQPFLSTRVPYIR